MADEYGSDFMTIIDEDGTEYELEVLATVTYNDAEYLAVIPATGEEVSTFEISILKSQEDDDGEPLLCAVEDEAELQAVYDLIMDQIYDDQDDE